MNEYPVMGLHYCMVFAVLPFSKKVLASNPGQGLFACSLHVLPCICGFSTCTPVSCHRPKICMFGYLASLNLPYDWMCFGMVVYLWASLRWTGYLSKVYQPFISWVPNPLLIIRYKQCTFVPGGNCFTLYNYLRYISKYCRTYCQAEN